MPRRDEDALSWDGDDDPTLVTGGSDASGPPPPLPEEARTDRAPSPAATEAAAVPVPAASAVEAAHEGHGEHANGEPANGEHATEGLGTAALVSIGVLGGVYLLFAIGWLVGGLRLQGRYQVLVTDSMYQGALWLATAAPLIWFATTLFATRNTRAWVRWLWLAFGVLLLIPWPFLMIGAVGR